MTTNSHQSRHADTNQTEEQVKSAYLKGALAMLDYFNLDPSEFIWQTPKERTVRAPSNYE